MVLAEHEMRGEDMAQKKDNECTKDLFYEKQAKKRYEQSESGLLNWTEKESEEFHPAVKSSTHLEHREMATTIFCSKNEMHSKMF